MEWQENRLQLVLNNLPVLVAFLDNNLKYDFANQLHHAWFGTDPDLLSGRHIRDVIGNEAYSVLESHIEAARSGEKSTFKGKVPYTHGGQRFIHGTAIPLPGTAAEDGGIMLLATDLTEQKLMEDELDTATLRNQTVLDTAVDGIITIDEKGIIQSCNKSAQMLFGYNAKELIGQNVSILMPSPHAKNHDNYLERYLETGVKRIIGIGREVTGKRKDGSEFSMELAVGEFTEDGRHFFTGFTRDITDRKKAEYDARTHLNELAHISRLNTNYHLASNISHEINQPLTAIVTMAQALLRNIHSGRNDPTLIEGTLEKIARQGSRASHIIQEIRQYYSKGDSGKPSPNNIDDIITDVLLLLEHEVFQNNIKVETDLNNGDTMIYINRVQIEQVILNLVQNAIEAMAGVEGEHILSVKTTTILQDYPYVEVSIMDNGPGLPEEGEEIFEHFFTTKQHGMGQGLPLCRSIIEAHGGTIKASPRLSHGTTFSFVLPIEPIDSAA